jgi:anti-sigma B factor antagonist
MEIQTQELKRVTLFVINGRIDSTNATELGDALNTAIDAGRTQIVVDLSNVEYMSSAGLRELVTALKKVKKGTGDLRLASPSERVQDVLDLAGLDTIFEIYDNQVEAVGSF